MKPKGFWSYARGDDEHLDGSLTALRKAIAGEVSLLMGEDVGIFQDIHDLRTGDRWEEKLREGLGAASFLVPVLTPRFFKRPWCREEVLAYLRLSEELGLEPRIFPIRFVEWDEEDGCEVRAALTPFLYKDFSNWRFENDPTQRAQLQNAFGKDVKARLQLPATPRPAKPAAPPVRAPESLQTETLTPARTDAPPPPKYKTHIVDPMPNRGDFHSIQNAIDAAEPGDKIVVREGTYRESLRLSKPLEIVGEGDRERILVVSVKGNALHCDAPMASVSGLRFRREAGEDGVGIWITAGAAVIEDCVVESLSLACVQIGGNTTTPTLRRCLLRDGTMAGLFIFDGAAPLVEDCTFSGNANAGVAAKDAATVPTLRRCIAENGKSGGYHFYDGAGGVMDQCEAIGNAFSGVEIRTGASPHLRDCTLRDNRESGLVVYDSGLGRVDGGRIAGNGRAGVNVQMGGAPGVTGCTITGNAWEAIWIADATSTGRFRDNDLRGNARGAWDIAKGAKVELSGNRE